jgi:hypothetical protein
VSAHADPFAEFLDETSIGEVLSKVAEERKFTQQEVAQDLAKLDEARVRTVGNLRVLSVKQIEALKVPPVVMAYLLRIKGDKIVEQDQ